MAQGQFLVLRVVDGGEVEIQQAVLGVENLDVPRDRLIGCAQGDILDAAYLRRDFLSQRVRGIEPEELAGGVVQEHDLAVRIEDDEAFLQRLEDIFQEALFLDQPGHDLLDLARLNAIDPGHELF